MSITEQIRKASYQGKQLKFLNTTQKIDLIGTINRHYGLKQPDPDQLTVLTESFRTTFSLWTDEEVKLAISLQMSGQLSCDMEIFGSLAPVHIGKLMNAYKALKQQVIRTETATEKEPLTQAQKDEKVAYGIMRMFKEFKKSPDLLLSNYMVWHPYVGLLIREGHIPESELRNPVYISESKTIASVYTPPIKGVVKIDESDVNRFVHFCILRQYFKACISIGRKPI